MLLHKCALTLWPCFLAISGWLSGCQLANPDQGTNKRSSAQANEKVIFKPADTAYINKLLQKAYFLWQNKPDSAIVLYQDVLEFSKGVQYYPGAATAYNNLAACYAYKGDYKLQYQYQMEAIAYINAVIPQAKAQKLRDQLRKLYPALANFYSYANNYDSVVAIRPLVASLYDLQDSSQRICYLKLQSSIASAYEQIGAYDSAAVVSMALLPYLQPADSNTYTLLGDTYLNLGSVFSSLSNETKAQSYYKQAEQVAHAFNDTVLQVNILNNIANFHLNQQEFQKAIRYAKRAMDLAKQFDTMPLVLRYYLPFNYNFIMAASLMQDSQAIKALPYSNAALKFAIKSYSPKRLSQAYYLLAANYIRTGRPGKAIPLLRSSIEICDATGQQQQVANGYGQLAIAYESTGDYKKAYLYLSRYDTLQEQLQGTKSAQVVAETNSRYQLSEKNKILAQNALQISRQQIKIKNQYIGIGIIFSSALFITLLLIIIMRRRKHRAEIERLKAVIAGEEQERSRMARELHDGIVSRLSIIKTTFCTLPSYSRGDNEEIAFKDLIRQLDQSIAELRTTSHNLLPEVLKQEGLTGSLQSYCRKISQTGLLTLEFQVVGTLPALTEEFQLNIYRILQEIVNNIIKHANASSALIQFNVRDQQLEITIDDDGKNIHTETLSKEHGIGKLNLYQRLQLLNGTMEIERSSGTSVYLTFDLKQFVIQAA